MAKNLGSPLVSTYQKSEPFLWFHVVLLAAVPITLVSSAVGLSVGDPILPAWMEISILGIPPTILPVILQWWRPFSPFGLWILTQPLDQTDENQRRILTVVKDFKTGLIAIAVGIVANALFCQIYVDAPLINTLFPIPSFLRLLGVTWAVIFFLITNLFLQAGVVAIRILLMSEAELNKLPPYPLEKVNSSFTVFGKRSPQLLDFPEKHLKSEPEPEAILTKSAPEPPKSEPTPLSISSKPEVASKPEVDLPSVSEAIAPDTKPEAKPEPEILPTEPEKPVEPPKAESTTSVPVLPPKPILKPLEKSVKPIEKPTDSTVKPQKNPNPKVRSEAASVWDSIPIVEPSEKSSNNHDSTTDSSI